MSRNRKPKPNSDDEETIPIMNTRRTERPTTQGSQGSQCSICLDELTNPCKTNSCSHLHCFECLHRWSNCARYCPLCRKTFSYIYHSFNDVGVHETYNVPNESSADPLEEYRARILFFWLCMLYVFALILSALLSYFKYVC